MSLDLIYLLGADGELVEMKSQAYDSELLLQRLLADHPRLLGGQDGESGLLLIDTEVGVPEGLEAQGRWALDHLFIDPGGVPTLVEVKRSTNREIRRTVVGQMLEYAANGSKWWPVDELRQRFEKSCHARQDDPEERLRSVVGPDRDLDDYWSDVETNLRAGRLRMLFVADVIPPELQAIVEFLNEQLSQAEVLAVEVRQYADAITGTTTLVPRVIGQTAEVIGKKSSITPRQWDEDTFIAALNERGPGSGVDTAKHLLRWARSSGGVVRWGRGAKEGTAKILFNTLLGELHPFTLITSTTARAMIQFDRLMTHPSFSSDDDRLSLRQRLNNIRGVEIPEEQIRSWPGIPLPILAEPDSLQHFIATMEWVVAKGNEES